MIRTIPGLGLMLASLWLAGCSHTEELTPVRLDDRQTHLFEQSCKTCHVNPSSPAPQVGDKAAWAKRTAQGLPTLVQHAITGYNAMPAGGMCITCTPPDFEAMIRYMATSPTP